MNSDKKSLDVLLKTLNNGSPIVIPTETVYGLAARIDQPEAIEKIFFLKKRPFFDPLIVHIYDTNQLQKLTQFESPILSLLIQKFWPGPLTLVLPKSDQVNPLITSGLDSVGIRMPSHPIALKILKLVDIPLAAPSANLFGHTSPTKAMHVENDFNLDSLLILDGGECSVGIESTVLKVEKNLTTNQIELCILRSGVITKSNLTNALEQYSGQFFFKEQTDKRSSPGHMKHHYMPRTPLIFIDKDQDVTDLISNVENDFINIPDEIEGIKIKKPILPIKNWGFLNFSTDPQLACRELYNKLKTLSEENYDILVFQKKDYMSGENWEGFLERLTKAASLHY